MTFSHENKDFWTKVFRGDWEDREDDRKFWQDLEKREAMENTRKICHKTGTNGKEEKCKNAP